MSPLKEWDKNQKKITKKAKAESIIISDLFMSFKFLISELFVVPKITLLVSQSIYAAPSTTPKVANIAAR